MSSNFKAFHIASLNIVPKGKSFRFLEKIIVEKDNCKYLWAINYFLCSISFFESSLDHTIKSKNNNFRRPPRAGNNKKIYNFDIYTAHSYRNEKSWNNF